MRLILLILIFNVVNIVFSLDQALAKQQTELSSRLINVDKYGNLSVEIKQAPLIDVVREIKRQTNIKFKVQAKANPKITCRFANLPLKRGLKRLFRKFDYVFIHADGESIHPDAAIENIILLTGNSKSDTNNQGEKKIIPQVSSRSSLVFSSPDPDAEVIRDMEETEIQATLSDIRTVLSSDPDENVRTEAVQALASQDSKKRVPILFDALDDESEKVRSQVITTLGVIDTEEASEAFKVAVEKLDQH